MIPQPLHPAVVHFPIALVVLLPLAIVVALVAIRRGGNARRSWMPVVAMSALLAISAFVAVQTGEREEEPVERVVAESAIHGHEEAAELFLPLTVGMLLLASAGLLHARAGKASRYGAAVAAVLLVGAGYRVGHSGGQLVYEHGAAGAYVQAEPRSSLGYPAARGDEEGRERDRDGEDEDGRR